MESFLAGGALTVGDLSNDLEAPLPEDEGLTVARELAVEEALTPTEDAFEDVSAIVENSVDKELSAATVGVSAVLASRPATFFSFKRWLDRVRAVDALVADRRELGALPEGCVVMVTREG